MNTELGGKLLFKKLNDIYSDGRCKRVVNHFQCLLLNFSGGSHSFRVADGAVGLSVRLSPPVSFCHDRKILLHAEIFYSNCFGQPPGVTNDITSTPISFIPASCPDLHRKAQFSDLGTATYFQISKP